MTINLQNYFDILNENFILIVSSNSKEKKAINNIIEKRKNFTVNISTHGCSIGMIKDLFVVHITGTSGIADEFSISRLIIQFIKSENIPSPSIVLIAGICWGNPNKVSTGDIIVCSSIYSLNSKVLEKDNTTYKVKDYTSKISTDLILDELKTMSTPVVVGKLASLETLYSSTKKRDELVLDFPSILGGEMEGFGLIPSLDNIPWLIIKSVSDYGDDEFGREGQDQIVKLSTDVIEPILSLLVNSELISLESSSPSKLLLVNELIGNILKISDTDFDLIAINDYLNDYIGPIIEYKLGFYLTSDEYDNKFLHQFCDLLLEVTQNLFRYEKASSVSITFNRTSIIVSSNNGIVFNLEDIEGTDGGASAWRKVKTNFLDNEFVHYVLKKKRYHFNLIRVNKRMIEIINNCTATIMNNSIRTGFEPKSILTYNDSCTAVYVNDRHVLMSSRRKHLINEIKELLDKGLIVYVSVSDKEYAEEYTSKFKTSPKNLKILLNR